MVNKKVNKYSKAISKFVENYIKENDITNKQFAKRIKYPPSFVSKIIDCKIKFTIRTITLIETQISQKIFADRK